jgi:hypothetical protein
LYFSACPRFYERFRDKPRQIFDGHLPALSISCDFNLEAAMRAAQAILGFVGFTLLFSAQTVLSQNETVSPRESVATSNASVAPAGASGFFGRHGRGWGRESRVVTGEPYSAVRTSSFVETLANGSTINRTTTTQEARDSSGRMYRATQFTSGSGSELTRYSVFDPVNRLATTWNSNTKQAVVTHLPNIDAQAQSSGAQSEGTAAASSHRHGPAPQVQQLGTKTIAGVEATGTSSTVTFPAGTFGNTQAIVVTRERWVAADLGITVSETDSDPRRGTRTTTVTNIQRSEPNAALFQAPQGYALVERTPGQHF